MMKFSIATSSLLLALAAGLAGPVFAADETSPALAPDPCAASSREIAAVAAHLRDARAQRTGKSAETDAHATLASALDAHLEALHANLPAPGTQRALASLLLSDMRDAVSLMRSAARADARELAARRIEDDHRRYRSLLTTLGCTDTRPTPLLADSHARGVPAGSAADW